MGEKIKKSSIKFNPKESIKRAREVRRKQSKWSINISEGSFEWDTKMERVGIIRRGLPYEAIEFISKKANIPVRKILELLGVPQTTYNKKRRENDLLNGRDSELILVLTELLDFGISVFNDEKEKFQRWLKKPNTSLGGITPESLFDSLTGIQEVRNSLNRLEYGNMA
ncbi:MAG: type II RES/Xre toxin-antitoxin system antitoxin [Bacteroidota bacterium]